MSSITAAPADRWAGRWFALALALSVVVLFAPSATGAPLVPGLDKVVHLALFALLAGTTRWRFGAGPQLLAAVVVYAVASEVAQAALLSDRSGDVYDTAADVVGAVAGWLVAGRLLRGTARASR